MKAVTEGRLHLRGGKGHINNIQTSVLMQSLGLSLPEHDQTWEQPSTPSSPQIKTEISDPLNIEDTSLAGKTLPRPKREDTTLHITQNHETRPTIKSFLDQYSSENLGEYADFYKHEDTYLNDSNAKMAPDRMDFHSHTLCEPENVASDLIEYDRAVSQTPQSDGSYVVIGEYVDEKKNQIIDEVVIAVTNWLRSRFLLAHQATGNTGEASQPQGAPPAQPEQRQSSNNPDRSKKRKLRERGGDDNMEDDTDDDQDPYHIGTSKAQGKRRELAKLACPYFKYNPAKYKEWRICPGPGWRDVHRVKEHLYRRHRQPRHRCGRCWQPFDDEQDYVSHQRTTEPCSLKEKEPIEGFDASQEKKLKSRKKVGKDNDTSEVAKWQAVFSILFPHVPKEDIPTPFYDYDRLASVGPDSQNYLTECEEYILREVPPRLRQILRPELDRDLNIIEESLKIRAIDCVKTLLEDTFREFRQVHQQKTIPETKPESVSLAEEAGPSSSSGPSSTQPLAATILQGYDIGSFEQNTFLGFDSGLDFFDPSALANLEASLGEGVHMEEILQPTNECREQRRSDSGYDSNIADRPSQDLSE
ncbi:hypothetical protein F5B20DRAFT_520893 [Whalleya microplaca]|nr:hypothetical protein F5B20DRAFT_520893 [Whalleya microplaca]